VIRPPGINPKNPLVSVVTAVYNGEKYLDECIESVLRQTYATWEYLIVNNCSTDKSVEIAQGHARRDVRIRIVTNREHVGAIENHNIALNLISPDSKYCKVVCADDWLFPECIERMVTVAEQHPTVGIVGSYQLSGRYVKWMGFPYPEEVFSGRELCRRIFLGEDKTFGFGTPTSMLYRADLVRKREAFYPNISAHADTSACFKELQDSDFGFVYQVLSYERIHEDTQSTKSVRINDYSSAYINDLLGYGPYYLTEEELALKLSKAVSGYYEFLAANLLMARGKAFWDYHRTRLKDLGFPITPSRLLFAFMTKALRELRNPIQAFEKIQHRLVK